jgi:hypothetical protein
LVSFAVDFQPDKSPLPLFSQRKLAGTGQGDATPRLPVEAARMANASCCFVNQALIRLPAGIAGHSESISVLWYQFLGRVRSRLFEGC